MYHELSAESSKIFFGLARYFGSTGDRL